MGLTGADGARCSSSTATAGSARPAQAFSSGSGRTQRSSPGSSPTSLELGVTEEQAADAVQWVEADGAVRSGHEAIAAVLGSAGRIWRLAGLMLRLPGISWIAARAYRLVADNRYRLPGGTPACARRP